MLLRQRERERREKREKREKRERKTERDQKDEESIRHRTCNLKAEKTMHIPLG